MCMLMLAREFAEKAKVNAEFVLAALRGLGRDALVVRSESAMVTDSRSGVRLGPRAMSENA